MTLLEVWLHVLADTQLAQWVRYSRWGYAAINTAHVFSIALLLGSIIPLDLKLIGFWRRLDTQPIAQILVPVAITGLIGAVASGLLLFLAGPADYAALNLFVLKILLITLATINALHFHWRVGYSASMERLRLAGGISLILWVCVLVSGRMIAYF